jgi:hypothetical protein
LEKEGFRDHEHIDFQTGDVGHTFRYSPTGDLRRSYSPDRERYYQLAVQWTWELRDLLPRVKAIGLDIKPLEVIITIWDIHANGGTWKEAAKAASTKRAPVTVYQVQRIVNMNREAMLRANKEEP